MNKGLILFLFLSFSVFVFSKEAYAYLDAGTGSYVIQVVIAFIFGGLLSVKIFWNRIKGFLTNLFPRKD